jgi:hypothetical protein
MEKLSVKYSPPVVRVWIAALSFFTILLLVSCNQDPLFYKIYQEVKPLEPLIKGVPTNFVEFNGGVYVASSSLYRYAKNAEGKAKWNKVSQPDGKIYALAATSTLYALTSSGLYKLGGSEWKKISIESGDGTKFSSLQTIYGADDTLFVAGWNGKTTVGINNSNFAIFYEANDVLKLVKPDTALLSGAIKSAGLYYLATNGAGIYTAAVPGLLNSSQQALAIIDAENARNKDRFKIIVALVKLNNTVTAITRNGDFLKADTTGFSILKDDYNQGLTGAVALWRDKNSADKTTPRLLLLGLRAGSGTTTYGYREIVLNESGDFITDRKIKEPGTVAIAGDPTSVSNKDRYDETIGSHPVNYLFQAPYDIDPDMTLFAAIQGTGKASEGTDGGVWSYRDRKNGWQWNAEE